MTRARLAAAGVTLLAFGAALAAVLIHVQVSTETSSRIALIEHVATGHREHAIAIRGLNAALADIDRRLERLESAQRARRD